MPYYYQKTVGYLQGVLEKIKNAIYVPVGMLEVEGYITPEPVTFAARLSGDHRRIAIGESWGKLWDCAWLHFTGQVPAAAAGRNVVLLIDISGEACVVDREGNPVQGLTTVSSEYDHSLGRPGKRVFPLFADAVGEETIDLWADAGCNDLFGKYQDSGTLREAHVAICREDIRQLFYDFEVLLELMQHLPEDTARRHGILCALNEAAGILKNGAEEEVVRARAVLRPELDKKGGDASLKVSAIGHAHIDLAWLWPIRETIRKGARTFSTVLTLMERYPDYVFGASQPQLYQWMKEHYPALYRRIGERIAEGRWEAQGAMWVEADTNVSGGEALVRQILYGKRFFREEYGRDMKVLWLPDVFGYTGALPQLLRKAGVDYFMTIKLSWSEINRFPHHTFLWEGIDGSTVLAHMPPEGTYNSSAAPRAIIKAEKEYQDKGVSDECLLLFGIGDGGGGPGEEHLERLVREKNLNGMAPVVQEPSLDLFRRLEKGKERYKVWKGELYLEKHQGTYTTQANNKRYNRKMEISLHNAEFLCMLDQLHCGNRYPAEELETIWKEVLLYQFHDILPGSSIDRVYEESLERYRVLLDRTEAIVKEALERLSRKVDSTGYGEPVLIVNTTSWPRKEWLKFGERWLYAEVPANGFSVTNAALEVTYPVMVCTPDILENDKVRVEFAPDGSITRLLDKENAREAIPSGGQANVLAVYEDHGDAWDFPMGYDERKPEFFGLKKVETTVDGPVAKVIHTYAYGRSSLVQEVRLAAGSRRIDFVTRVDWRESHKMLRTSFPVDVYATEATCEIQFGNIKRPTHRNTSWDMAKYEICAHKWVDISQGDYGVALLNDCKYGHKVYENILDLNLLRSPEYPGTKADKTQHEFTYSLLPHAGGYAEGGVVEEGYRLNIPLLAADVVHSGRSLSSRYSFVATDCPDIVVETVKKAEDSDDMIIRMYESQGRGTKAKLSFGFQPGAVVLVDLMEEACEQDSWDSGTGVLTFKPFEIHTMKVSI